MHTIIDSGVEIIRVTLPWFSPRDGRTPYQIDQSLDNAGGRIQSELKKCEQRILKEYRYTVNFIVDRIESDEVPATEGSYGFRTSHVYWHVESKKW